MRDANVMKHDLLVALGLALERAREEAGMSIGDFTRKAGRAASEYAKLRRGAGNHSIEVLCDLAVAANGELHIELRVTPERSDEISSMK